MGIKQFAKKAGEKAGNTVAKLASLSPGQLEEIEKNRAEYLSQMPSSSDEFAEEYTYRLLGASSIEIFNAYLPRLNDLYAPIDNTIEYGEPYQVSHNVRYIKITKWVTDKSENSLEKLVNVYQVLSNEECNIALVFHRTCTGTEVYLAVANTKNADNNVDANNYIQRLTDAVRGNFPGAEWEENKGTNTVPCLDNEDTYSVAITSNAPTEKSEKFVSQTIEKLLDGIVPSSRKKEYILILLATPVQDIEERKLQLAQFYTGLVPYSSWTTTFTYQQTDSTNSSATFGVNAGVSAGVQHGQSLSQTQSQAISDSSSSTTTDSSSEAITESSGQSSSITESTSSSVTESDTHAVGSNTSETNSITAGASASVTSGGSTSVSGGVTTPIASANVSASTHTDFTLGGHVDTGHASTAGTSITDTSGVSNTAGSSIGNTLAESTGKAIAKTVGQSVANTLGKAVTNGVANTAGISKGVNLGGNFGANFARSSNVTVTVGKNEGITQSFINYNIKHALEILEEQTKRLEEGTALGMWDFAAYVLSEDPNTANNVAHSYVALTQGENSYKSKTAVNMWRGDMGKQSGEAQTICSYLKELRHPTFGLNPEVLDIREDFYEYPMVVTATTSLSGKELAYALNFPKHAIAGLPILQCAEFGRNVVSYDLQYDDGKHIDLGRIFHMNHEEPTNVDLSLESLRSHAFITGSTGAGKSNTIYHLLQEANEQGVHFLIIDKNVKHNLFFSWLMHI